MQFLPFDDEHMCSKHVEAWNKLIVKQKCCASSCLITEINILRCTVSKTSKYLARYISKVLKDYNPLYIICYTHWHRTVTAYIIAWCGGNLCSFAVPNMLGSFANGDPEETIFQVKV